MSVDMYRVGLFKKVIKAAIPGGHHIRFQSSRDRSHLIIPIGHVYYPRERAEECAEIVVKALKPAGIEFVVETDPFGFHRSKPESERPTWCISIPIDQAALPERKR